ncbi:MAG TPA: YwqG family protein [Kofleriaceae bacterium]|jgi:uncharacterized protein YwqG
MTLGERLRAAFDKHDASEALREQILPMIQPAIAIDATPVAAADALDEAIEQLPLGASRFGGIPDLPPGAAWPMREDVPMEFVAQLRLVDVAPLDPLGRLPARGSLLFFYNSQWVCSDADRNGACCAVLFHDGPDDTLVRTPPPRIQFQGEYDREPRTTPRVHGMESLAFTATESAPASVSPWAPEGSEAGWQDFAADHAEEWRDGEYDHHALGFVQAQDYANAHVHGTDDQLLLQVDSDLSFEWGDCDRLYFLLTKEQLAARAFDQVRIYSQLG